MPDSFRFILYGGIGDHVLWLGYLAAFRAQAGQPVHIYCDERTVQIARLFPASYDKLFVAETIDPKSLSAARMPPVADKIFLCWHCYHVGDELQYLGPDEDIGTLIKTLLGLPPDAAMVHPTWPPIAYAKARDLIRRNGLTEGHTTLLVPVAKSSLATLSPDWWTDLTAHLIDQQQMVVTNTANGARGFDQHGVRVQITPLPHTHGVDIPLELLGPLVELAGHAITAGSGISSLIARCHLRHTVVWPYLTSQRPFFHTHFRVWSIGRVYGSAATELRLPSDAGFDSALFG